jgi:hypothetical protein
MGASDGKSPAVEVGKARSNGDGVITLSTGIRARLKPVAASLINEVTNRVRDPKVPMWHDPDKDRDVPHPDDPEYLEARLEAQQKRSSAALDAMILFGVELVDGVPDESEWLPKLQFMAKAGHISLEGYDLTSEFEREFVFKKYIAVGTNDLDTVGSLMGITEEAVKRAAESFPGPQARDTD